MNLVPLSAQQELVNTGYSFLSPVQDPIGPDFFTPLGEVIVDSRDGSNYKDLVPYEKESAPKGSMSASIGMLEQPMHTDGAYRATPPRYIALQCIEAGESTCPTNIQVIDFAALAADSEDQLTRPSWVFRGGGFSPFYAPILETVDKTPRVRFDQFCMFPPADCPLDSRRAAELFETHSQSTSIQWEPGALLIIDNWRCLHARGSGAATAPSRKLRRWYIGGN